MRGLRWLNILGLDAALIAISWQAVFAVALGAPPGAASVGVLAASVWLTYQADRLFDAAKRPPEQLPTERHRFAKRHFRTLWTVWAVVLAVTCATAFLHLPQAALLRGGALLGVCLLYTAANQAKPGRFFPKEVLVGGIFAAGAGVLLEIPLPRGAVLALGMVCVLNCLLISSREHAADAAMGVPSLGAALPSAAWTPLFGAAAVVLFAAPSALAPPLGISLALLFALHRCGRSLPAERFRLMADWSLLVGPAFFAASRAWLN